MNEYRPLSDLERTAIEALQHVRPRQGEGSSIKRMAKWGQISERGETRLWKMVHRYRRQLPALPDAPTKPGMSEAAQVAALHRAGYRTRGEAANGRR
jgi:hypothetical protein